MAGNRYVAVSQTSGRVTVAPEVLARLVSLAVHELPGVARAGRVPRAAHLSMVVDSGVVVRPGSDGTNIDCYLIAQLETNLLDLGAAVQMTVVAVAQDLAGIAIREVNVYIQDVEAALG